MRPQDPHPHLTEADRDSQTRFGTRRVPPGHRTASPYPHRKMVSSRIPPSGPVSPDGRHVWPRPSLAARIIVWGGVAAGVAGLTAAGVAAGRMIAGDDRPAPRAHVAPRFAQIDEDEREAMRRRVRAQARADAEAAARLRAQASRRRGTPAQRLSDTANEVSTGLNSVVASVLSAFEAFNAVAGRARGIVQQFTEAADQIRDMTARRGTAAPRPGHAATPVRPDQDR